jgi:alpha-beta hydrolase superfamily lysophospholipase
MGADLLPAGESMGALYVTPLAMRNDPSISGVILCGGLVKLAKETAPPGIIIMILKLVGRLFPKMKMPVSSRLPSSL